MRSSAGPGAAFECRLDRTSREGPLRVPCEVVARIGGAYDNGTAPFYYDIIANPMEAGTYDLRVLWMHSTHKEAFSPTSKPLCRVLRAGGDERLGKVKVPKERSVSRPCAGYQSKGPRAHDGRRNFSGHKPQALSFMVMPWSLPSKPHNQTTASSPGRPACRFKKRGL